MNERSRAILVIACIFVFAWVGYHFFLQPFFPEQQAVERVRTQKSTWQLTMQAYQLEGPIGSETFRISNDNGKIQMFYSATSRDGLVTKQFKVPIDGPSGTFLFEDLRADGIWELDDRAIRKHPRDEYVVQVAQTLGDQGGSRAFGFSDPHYWATTKAQQFQLHRPKGGSASGGDAALPVSGKTLRDDRYEKIVRKIRAFGPPSVLQAENTIRTELAARATATHRKSNG